MFRNNPKKYGVFSSYHDTSIRAGWIQLNSRWLAFQRKAPNVNFATEVNCQQMFSILQRGNALSNFIWLVLAYVVWKSSHTNFISDTDFLYLMRTLMTTHSWYQPLCGKTCWTCLMELVRISINKVTTLYVMLVIMTHYFVRS
jgi:hypothetical protein